MNETATKIPVTRAAVVVGLQAGPAPEALEAARDDALARMDRLMTRMRAVEGQLLQAGRAARSGFKGVAAVPANL